MMFGRNSKGDECEMFNEKKIVHSKVVTEATKAALLRRGVTIEAVAEIVYEMQTAVQ